MKPPRELGPDYPLSIDTPRAIEMKIIEGMRDWTPAQRIRRVSELNNLVRRLAEQDIREKYPEADDREVKMRLASRFFSRDLMIKAYGWDPAKGKFVG